MRVLLGFGWFFVCFLRVWGGKRGRGRFGVFILYAVAKTQGQSFQYCVGDGWELLDAQCEFLQWQWNVFLHEEMSPSPCERKQMECRDVPASCTQRCMCCVKEADGGEEECPLLAPDKSISVLSEMAVKWELHDFFFLCRSAPVTFISFPLCTLAYSFCVPIYPKSLLGVLD